MKKHVLCNKKWGYWGQLLNGKQKKFKNAISKAFFIVLAFLQCLKIYFDQ
jgi:hypothetical protein